MFSLKGFSLLVESSLTSILKIIPKNLEWTSLSSLERDYIPLFCILVLDFSGHNFLNLFPALVNPYFVNDQSNYSLK